METTITTNINAIRENLINDLTENAWYNSGRLLTDTEREEALVSATKRVESMSDAEVLAAAAAVAGK